MTAISAYILAGGKSTRMETEKGLLKLNGYTFAALIVNALKAASIKKITIVSENKVYDNLNCERIADIQPNKGPVGGIFTALSHTKTKHNIILSVDIPLITDEIIKWLMINRAQNKKITQVKVLDKSNPLIAIYNKELVDVFEKHIIQNQLKLQMVVNEIPHQTIEAPETWYPFLQNINTKEDYQNLIK